MGIMLESLIAVTLIRTCILNSLTFSLTMDVACQIIKRHGLHIFSRVSEYETYWRVPSNNIKTVGFIYSDISRAYSIMTTPVKRDSNETGGDHNLITRREPETASSSSMRQKRRKNTVGWQWGTTATSCRQWLSGSKSSDAQGWYCWWPTATIPATGDYTKFQLEGRCSNGQEKWDQQQTNKLDATRLW
jgi:hypothetical protein